VTSGRVASARSTAYDVRATDLARIASMPASSTSSSMLCIATIPRMGGVPEMNLRMPGAGL
jgi:hypothetical protein